MKILELVLDGIVEKIVILVLKLEIKELVNEISGVNEEKKEIIVIKEVMKFIIIIIIL